MGRAERRLETWDHTAGRWPVPEDVPGDNPVLLPDSGEAPSEPGTWRPSSGGLAHSISSRNPKDTEKPS